VSNDQSGGNASTNQSGADGAFAEVDNSPVLQGHSALNDPNLSGSTTADWTGTAGPDPGGMAGEPGETGADTDGSRSPS